MPVLRIHGQLTEAGWPALAEACGKVPGRLRVLDFSGVTHCQTATEDAASFGRRLGRQSAATPEPSCHIMIAPGDLLFGLCRIIQMNLDMARIKAAVFRSVTAATHWLEEENLLPDVAGT